MIARALRRFFADNVALKAIALVLAVSLFVLVHGEQDAVVSIKVRVVYTPPEDRVLVSEPMDAVTVRVRGPWTRVKRFGEDDVEPIHVDLSNASSGDFFFLEEMVRLPPGLKVVSISPPAIRLELEKYASKEVTVTPAIVGTPSRGYQIERSTVDPRRVKVRGAKSVIESTASVQTRPVSVDGRSYSFSERIGLDLPEPRLRAVDVNMVRVDVEIIEEPAELIYRQVPVKVATMGAGGVAPAAVAKIGVQPESVVVVLRGSRKAIDRVSRAQVSARVELVRDDAGTGKKQKLPVLIDGIPRGVSAETQPREVVVSRRGVN
ncbi:MAG: CdaR family protein [Pseudomonadota bacterium]